MEGNYMVEHHRNKYMMWMNMQQVLMPRGRAASSSYHEYESWEERAFAEDAARGNGGFIWPPRSYTCGFCRREFKSAQALGGHMNVHRRDRARLKQALSPHRSETIVHADHSLQQTKTKSPTWEDSPTDDCGDDHERKKCNGVLVNNKRDDKEHVSTKLCMGLSLDEVVAANNKCKRIKSGNFILVDPYLVVQSSTPFLHHEGHLGGLKMRLMEELDLELRLGV